MTLAALLYIYRVSQTTTIAPVTPEYIENGSPHVLQGKDIPGLRHHPADSRAVPVRHHGETGGRDGRPQPVRPRRDSAGAQYDGDRRDRPLRAGEAGRTAAQDGPLRAGLRRAAPAAHDAGARRFRQATSGRRISCRTLKPRLIARACYTDRACSKGRHDRHNRVESRLCLLIATEMGVFLHMRNRRVFAKWIMTFVLLVAGDSGFRSGLEPEPSAESGMACARPFSRGTAAVYADGRLRHRHLAAVAEIEGAGGRHQSRGADFLLVLDAVFLCDVPAAGFHALGGTAGDRAAHRRAGCSIPTSRWPQSSC